MASERQDRLRALVLAACEDLGRYGLEPTPEAVAAVASLIVNASRLGAEVDAAAEIARLRAIIEADGLDPDAPMPPGLTVVNERLRRKLKEAWRERSAARAEAMTAQASLRRVERELEAARERERHIEGQIVALVEAEVISEGKAREILGIGVEEWREIEDSRALATDTEGGARAERCRPGQSGGLRAIFGRWPGDETDEEIREWLERES